MRNPHGRLSGGTARADAFAPARARRGGFTLVELLIVISILSLLLALLTPTLTRSRELTRRAICTHNQRNIVLAGNTYASENRNRFVYQHASNGWAWTHALTDTTHRPNWIYGLWPYVGNSLGLFSCPSNRLEAPPGSAYAPSEQEWIAYVANGVVTHLNGAHLEPSTLAFTHDDYSIQNAPVLRPHWNASGAPSRSTFGWVGWMRYDIGTLLTAQAHDGGICLSYMDAHGGWQRQEDVTSRDFGLLIGGEDTYEPEVPGYSNPARWGALAP